jgi:hypothetical protein
MVEHHVLSLEEVEAWPQRAVHHMVEMHLMVPTAADPTNVKELASASTGVNERDGVSDVPVAFGPTGARATQEEDAETGDDDETDVDGNPDDYPVRLDRTTYRLSDGSEVTGRAAAMKAQAKLDEA